MANSDIYTYDPALQAAQIARQQKMAELLQQQGEQPIDIQSYQGTQAPISWGSVLAKALKSGLGTYLGGKADQGAAALQSKSLAEAKAYYDPNHDVNIPGASTDVTLDMSTPGNAMAGAPKASVNPEDFAGPNGQPVDSDRLQARQLEMPDISSAPQKYTLGVGPYSRTETYSPEEQMARARAAQFSPNPVIRSAAAGEMAQIEAERERNQPKLSAAGEYGMVDNNPNSKTFGQLIIPPTVKAQKPEITGGLQRDPVTGVWSEIPGYTTQQAAIAAAHRESNGGEKPPSGYRSDGKGGLEFIPGGPADPGNKKRPPSQAFLRLETDDLKDVQLAGGIASDLDSFGKKIDTGKMTLGLAANLGSKAELALGMANQNAKEIGSFRTSLEKLRNDSLRLNKGVQTEGDAIRAWNELFQNINDQGFVRKRIDEIKQINRRAQAQRIMLINDRRELSGYDPIDENKYLNQPSAYENSNGAAAPGAGGGKTKTGVGFKILGQ